MVKVFKHKTVCDECNKEIYVYYTVSDFGDAPILMRCVNCGEYYWYTLDDVAYIKPIDKQLENLMCEKCGINLSDSLTLTHKNIRCCNNTFSLDDNFATNVILPDSEMVLLNVYMIYT